MSTEGGAVSDHAEWQDLIPGYVAERLDAAERSRLEPHLRDCPDCAETVATWREILRVSHGREGDLFSAHPDTAVLHRYARDATSAEARKVAQHLASCATCEIEVSAWHLSLRRQVPGRIALSAGPIRLTAAVAALCLLAGILLGAFIGLRLSNRGSRPPITERTARSTEGTSVPGTLDGPVPLLLLRGSMRGSEAEPAFEIDPRQSVVLLGAVPAIPAHATDEARFRLTLEGESGRALWTAVMSGQQVRQQVASAGVITVAVPSTTFSPGRYTLRMVAVEPPSEDVLHVVFGITR